MDRRKKKIIGRVAAVNLLYAAYSLTLCWGAISIIKDTKFITAWRVLSAVFILFHLVFSIYVIRKDDCCINKQTYCHVPMLLFIAFSIGPYGMALHNQYKDVNPAFKNITPNLCAFNSISEDSIATYTAFATNGNTVNISLMDGSCFDLEIPMKNFIVFQVALPLLVITYVAYPYPDRYYKPGEIFAIAIEFLNAFDILDLIEDIGCVQRYDDGWITLFYIVLCFSTLSLAFPVGLEDDDEDDPQWKRILRPVMKLIFTDIGFSIIRICVMVKEENVRTGFHFLIKNVLATALRPFLICYTARQ